MKESVHLGYKYSMAASCQVHWTKVEIECGALGDVLYSFNRRKVTCKKCLKKKS